MRENLFMNVQAGGDEMNRLYSDLIPGASDIPVKAVQPKALWSLVTYSEEDEYGKANASHFLRAR
jgi:hypothetical protein